MGRALAAPAAGRGYSRSPLHIPAMGPGTPINKEKKKELIHPNYDKQETLFRHKSKSIGEFINL